MFPHLRKADHFLPPGIETLRNIRAFAQHRPKPKLPMRFRGSSAAVAEVPFHIFPAIREATGVQQYDPLTDDSEVLQMCVEGE